MCKGNPEKNYWCFTRTQICQLLAALNAIAVCTLHQSHQKLADISCSISMIEHAASTYDAKWCIIFYGGLAIVPCSLAMFILTYSLFMSWRTSSSTETSSSCDMTSRSHSRRRWIRFTTWRVQHLRCTTSTTPSRQPRWANVDNRNRCRVRRIGMTCHWHYLNYWKVKRGMNICLYLGRFLGVVS